MVLSSIKSNKCIKGIVSEKKNFPDRWPFLRERAKAGGEQADRCVAKPAPIVINSKRRGKLSIFPREHKAVRMSKAKKRDRRKD